MNVTTDKVYQNRQWPWGYREPDRLGTVRAVISIPFDLDEDSRQTLESLVPAELPEDQQSDILGRMLCGGYLFVTEKL